MSQVVGSYSSFKPITNTACVRAQLCKLQKLCTRLAAARDKVYQLLVKARWFFPGTPLPPPLNTKSGRHDIAEILLKMTLRHYKLKSQSSHLVENEEPNSPAVYVFEYLVLCVVFCQSLSVFLFFLSSNYPFGIFKLFSLYNTAYD